MTEGRAAIASQDRKYSEPELGVRYGMVGTNETKTSAMPLKIGVMGGAGNDIPQRYLDKALRLGEAIAAEGCVTITGAAPGLPLAAARGAKSRGGTVVGISPGLSLDEHAYKYGSAPLADTLHRTAAGCQTSQSARTAISCSKHRVCRSCRPFAYGWPSSRPSCRRPRLRRSG